MLQRGSSTHKQPCLAAGSRVASVSLIGAVLRFGPQLGPLRPIPLAPLLNRERRAQLPDSRGRVASPGRRRTQATRRRRASSRHGGAPPIFSASSAGGMAPPPPASLLRPGN
ncbi:hypothetical protein NDU88_005373 [Pleurodeles waltl]|uniref:Uncharacterized protein n=1 Tax=Pleurodeles waltl TaxID=8319 RepID=A0AAV7LL46_PLEWA|nr:hypothetical protein NDU88_005373 [Pleurodeles waltl]